MNDDLGDFFAKKDKKNKKKKGTKIKSATLVEQLQSDNLNAEEKPQIQMTKEKENSIARADDNEWIEINNDNLAEGLSDLKIKSLDAKEEEDERIQQEQADKQGDGSDDENGSRSGAWDTLPAGPALTSTYHAKKPQVPSIPSNVVSGGKYIPPSQRQGGPVSQPPRRGREQLNVNSVDQFPDLNTVTTKTKEKHDPTFDMAKGKGRKVQQQTHHESMQLNNKFQVLGTN